MPRATEIVLHQASHQFLEIVAMEKYWELEKETSVQRVDASRTALDAAATPAGRTTSLPERKVSAGAA